MKKVMSLTLVIVMIGCLAACGSSLNDNNTRTAKAIISAVDDYLDGKTDATTAFNIVDRERDNIDTDDSKGISFDTSVTYIHMELSSMKYNGGGDLARIKDERDNIASLIGASKYKG